MYMPSAQQCVAGRYAQLREDEKATDYGLMFDAMIAL